LSCFPCLCFFILCYHLCSIGDTNKIAGTLEYTTLRKNLKSETDAPTGACLGSGKARHARVGVAQTWVEDGLYGDTCIVGASPFCNYRRHALKRRRILANARRLLLEGGRCALVKRITVLAPSPFKGAQPRYRAE
jgi:hypothetical protein